MLGSHHVRFALRALRRRPGFTLAALATLALGIGVNTALFTVVRAVLLAPMAYDEPDRVVKILGYNAKSGSPKRASVVSFTNFADWRAQAETFEAMAIFHGWIPTLLGAGEPVRVEAGSVSADFFDVFGVEPAIGRFFQPAEDRSGSSRAVVISHAFWRSRFAGDSDVVGKQLDLDGVAYEVIGVTPADFEDPRLGPLEPVVWRPSPAYFVAEDDQRGARSMFAVGRLRRGVPLGAAQAEIDTVMARLAERFPGDNANQAVALVPIREHLVGAVRPALALLFAASLLVLLIACANVANLQLARAAGRRREIALRRAIGASRRQIGGQLMAESLLLALAGGLLGTVLALWSVDLLRAVAVDAVPRGERIAVDGTVLLFAALLSLATTLGFGSLPALAATGGDLVAGLKTAAGRSGDGGRRLMKGVVVVEVALAALLLIAACLLLRSMGRLAAVDAGVQGRDVVTLQVDPSPRDYGDHDAITGLYGRLLPALASIPGVAAVGTVDRLPLTDNTNGFSFAIEGRPEPPPNEKPGAQTRAISPGYLAALDIPLLLGRGLRASDRRGAAQVVLINRTMADRHWPGAEALGARLTVMETTWTVVGVVGDVRHLGLDRSAPPAIYFAHQQVPNLWMRRTAELAVRGTDGPVSDEAIRRAIWSVDAAIPISKVRTMDQIVARSLARPRLRSALLGVFALLALGLGAVGVFSLVSFTAARRTFEVGVRVVCGARRVEIVRMMMRQEMTAVLVGIVLGAAGARLTAGAVAHLLFGVRADDPMSYVVGTATLAVAALVACYLPAARAARRDPVQALRQS